MEKVVRVYKVVNDIDDKIYVGTTKIKDSLCHRLGKYRTAMRKGTDKNNAFLQHMRTLGTEHFRIVLIEEFKCCTIDQEKKKRQEWVDRLDPELNRKHLTTESKNTSHVKKIQDGRTEFICGCGKKLTHNSKWKHNRTKRHIDYVEKTNYSTGNERSE